MMICCGTRGGFPVVRYLHNGHTLAFRPGRFGCTVLQPGGWNGFSFSKKFRCKGELLAVPLPTTLPHGPEVLTSRKVGRSLSRRTAEPGRYRVR